MSRLTIMAIFMVVTLTALGEAAEPIPSNSKSHVVQSKGRDFRLVSDREETVADFFRRHRVIVGGLPLDEGNEHGDLKSILAAEAEIPEVVLHHASPNDDPDAQLMYITKIRVAPPTSAVAKLLREFKNEDATRFVLILIRDEKGSEIYRPVGYTTHSPVGFFTKQFSGSVDGMAAKDLLFGPAKY